MGKTTAPLTQTPPVKSSQSGRPPSPEAAKRAPKKFTITQDIDKRAQRIVLYAPGGWGKTSLAAVAPGAVIIDLERRTSEVAKKLAIHDYKLNRITGLGIMNPDLPDEIDAAQAFQDVRDILHDSTIWQPGMTCVIDSATKLEEWSWAWVLANIKGEKNAPVNAIEGYGYGKGFTHGYEQMCKVLSDLDVLTSRGIHCILICHDCIANFDDPAQVGMMKRYEPRLYRSASGNTDTRLRVREWADCVFFGTFDMAKGTDGRIEGQGTRSIYTHERPAFMAKSSLPEENHQVAFAHEFDAILWTTLFGEA